MKKNIALVAALSIVALFLVPIPLNKAKADARMPKVNAGAHVPYEIANPIPNESSYYGKNALADMFVGNTDYIFAAFIGLDSSHHINIIGAINGLDDWETCNSYCNKRTITSTNNPAVSALPDPSVGLSIIAWNGHLYISYRDLNTGQIVVAFYNFTTQLQSAVEWGESTYYAPSLGTLLAYGVIRLYLAWTGTDSHLNFEYTTNGTYFQYKVTANQTSVYGPTIAAWPKSPAGWYLYVAWEQSYAPGGFYQPCIGYFYSSTNLARSHCLTDYSLPVQLQSDQIGINFNPSTGNIEIGFNGVDANGNTAIHLGVSSDGYNFSYKTLRSDSFGFFGATTAYHYPYTYVVSTDTGFHIYIPRT